MDARLLLTFLLFGWAEAASAGDLSLKSVRVWGAVTLPVTPPKGQSLNNLFLRDASRAEAVAVWMDSDDISILNIKYTDRVAFQKDEMAFRMANLSLDDGGTYEISTISSPSSPPDVLNNFLVAVFNISERTSSLGNDSCYIYLDCETGLGPGHRVTYAWKDAEAGTTLSHVAWLTQLVHSSQKMAYTCVAQTPTAQSAFSFVLQHLCNSAGPGPWAPGSLLAGGLLVAATLLLL